MPIPTIVMADRPVIVTLTMNPALDITTSAQRVGPTEKSVVMEPDMIPAAVVSGFRQFQCG